MQPEQTSRRPHVIQDDLSVTIMCVLDNDHNDDEGSVIGNACCHVSSEAIQSETDDGLDGLESDFIQSQHMRKQRCCIQSRATNVM